MSNRGSLHKVSKFRCLHDPEEGVGHCARAIEIGDQLVATGDEARLRLGDNLNRRVRDDGSLVRVRPDVWKPTGNGRGRERE